MKSGQRLFISLAALFLIAQACSKNDNTTPSTVHQISANLNGSQENPANGSAGTGTVTGSFDASTKTLTYSVTWSGLSGAASAAHFHGPAATTSNAPVLIPFTVSNGATLGSGTASGSVVLADSVVNFLTQGQLYANVHTAAKPGGEIRGQVVYQ